MSSCCGFFVPLTWQGKQHLFDGVSSLRRVTFYRKKVTKVLPRGDPLGIPLKQKGSLFFYFRHFLIEKANRLPRSPALAVIFGSLCLYFGVPNWKVGTGRTLYLQGTPKKRQKAVFYNPQSTTDKTPPPGSSRRAVLLFNYLPATDRFSTRT